MTLLAHDTEFGPPVNDKLFDAEAHAAMLEDYARHPEAVLAWAFVAALVWLFGAFA